MMIKYCQSYQWQICSLLPKFDDFDTNEYMSINSPLPHTYINVQDDLR
jgi:hypothetical protein